MKTAKLGFAFGAANALFGERTYGKNLKKIP